MPLTQYPVGEVARRHEYMIERLHAINAVRTPPVERALHAVPRHLFADAEHGLEQAYDATDVLITKRGADGKATSSVSAPGYRP